LDARNTLDKGVLKPKTGQFPVKFPKKREFLVETGSHWTAHTTIQSSQTAHFVGDSKEVVSAGISPVSSPDFPSLRTSAVSRADFWPPVSASKNSVPGSWISRGKDRSAAWKSGILGGKNAVSSGGRKLLRIKSKRFELSSILPEHRAVVQLQPRQATFDRIL